jgi:nucleoside-diphosphate-sugar epimerase
MAGPRRELAARPHPRHLIPPFRAEQHWAASSSRIRTELGYCETVTRGEALTRTVAWERANPAPFDPSAFDYEAEDGAMLSACGPILR